MHFTIVAATAALFASTITAQQYNNSSVTYSIEIVTQYTTYCPSPTSIVHGNYTYTVTEATTLTITNCPCTLTHTIPIPTPTPLNSSTAAVPIPVSTPIPAAPTYANATSPSTPSTAPSAIIVPGTTTSTTPISPAIHTAAAAIRMEMSVGAVVGLVFGLAGFLL